MKIKKKNKKSPNGHNGETNDDSQLADSTTKGEQQDQPSIIIQRIFVKNSSFDGSSLHETFGKDWKPHLDLNIQSNNFEVNENVHQVELNVTVTGKMYEKIIFTMSVNQTGIFAIENFSKDQLAVILGSECLKILYPYVRETITDLTSRATLPLLYLTPLNFDAIYAQQIKQKNQQNQQGIQ